MKKTVKVKRKKFNWVKFFLIILLLYLGTYGVYYLFRFPFKNIYVIPNTPYFSEVVKDQTVLELAKIDHYPSFLLTLNKGIKTRLLRNPHIKAVKIKRNWRGELYLYITEQPQLYYDLSQQKVMLGDGTLISGSALNYLPVLINYIPDTLLGTFIKKMGLIEMPLWIKISEIKYDPNEVDEERFLLMMDDGNYVYVTLNTFTKLNQYNQILAQLGSTKGILYLDAGNYFEIID